MNISVVKGEFMARPENPDRDIRKYARIPSGGRAELSWMADGKPEKTRARVIDVSGNGLKVKASRQLPPGTQVILMANRMCGAGTVRYCRRVLFSYNVGIELKGGTQRPL